MVERHVSLPAFSADFGRQMRFVTGPRQTGKTTVSKACLKVQGCDKLYYNWDQRDIRDRYRKDSHFFAPDLFNVEPRNKVRWICMDEIHKFPKWKNVLKDFFDTYENDARFIVTGSARLDMFRKSGDSLAGRYFTFRLNPLTLREVVGVPPAALVTNAATFLEHSLSTPHYHQEAFSSLLEYSGFPEPFSRATRHFHNKWRSDYVDRIIREDIRELTAIRELEQIAALLLVLPSRIGSPLSINGLTEDLKTSFASVSNYLQALEKTYLVFRLKPYAARIARTLTKETKVYFYDWTRNAESGPCFENYVAMELKSQCELWTDSGEGEFDLRYVRTRDGRESDFLLLRDGKPWLLAEAKVRRSSIEYHHLKNRETLGSIPFVQIVAEEAIAERKEKGVYQISAARFFA